MSESEGRVEAIWIKRAKRGPMDPVARTHAVAARGLEGNANQGGKRQVTLLSADSWADVVAELGFDVDPRLRRANVYLKGVDLRDSRGRTLCVGGTRIRIYGETRPCNRMEEAQAGLRAALDPEWRAGAFGEVLEDGEIEVGDAVSWLEE